MPQVLPFYGLRFDWRKVKLRRVLCPPYDVIPDALARRLRNIPHNTIHLELPRGGPGRYAAAARTWARWKNEGIVIPDLMAAYYVVEQRFHLAGKQLRRLGFLSALSLDEESLRHVVPHEKTLSKPKQDRLKMLAALHVQTSPIFALYDDPGRQIRKILARIVRKPPETRGLAPDGVFVRVWRVSEPDVLREIEAAFQSKRLLIADGHHRLEVSKNFGASSILCYLCAEEDSGLAVLPTHRVLPSADSALARLKRSCRALAYGSLGALERAVDSHSSPFAFGVVMADSARDGLPGKFLLAVPSASSGRGIRSGLGAEWLSRRLFSPKDFEHIQYTHDSREAMHLANESSGAAFLVKPVKVREIRRAVQRVGLLPQKSTYFYPKIEAGIVFHEVR